MAEASLLALAFLCAYCGMGWLSLALRPHWVQVCGPSQRSEPAVVRLRLLGSTGLLLSLAACLGADHASMALLVWVMTLGASALSVAMTLTYAPRSLHFLVTAAGTGTSRSHERRP